MELLLSKLAWVLLIAHQASAFCPPFMAQERACTCFAYLDGAVVKCKGPSAPAAVEKLKAVSAEIRELSIEEANIVEIGPRAFRNLRVKSLILDNNHIRSIHADAFRGLEDTLVTLSLAHNRLTEIPTDALMDMNKLLVLNLKCNSIGNLYNSAFRNVSRLMELNLGCNQICKIAGPAFETVKESVQSLILDQNCLQEIPAEALRNFKQLLALHLQYNAITSIEKLQLMNLVSLLMVRLTGNKIRSIDRYGFNNVPNLRYLFLDQNELVAIEPTTLQQFKYLEILDLSYNNIAEITAGAFNGLEHLLQLNLEGNTIKDIAPGAFANSPLLLLLLGYNCLTAISQQMFQGVPFLRQLSLTNNNIRLVQPFSFNGLPNMHMLDLSSNKIQNVQPTAITINPQTTVLLQENPMACTQGGYHIIQGGQPTMLLSEPNNVCKKDDGSNSTAAEDACPTRKEVPAAPACCSASAQTAVTSVTSSIDRLLHQSTPLPQKGVVDFGSLLPSLGKSTNLDATTQSAANRTADQIEDDNGVKFSSNRRLNMERFWRFTAAPNRVVAAPGIHAVPVTAPSAVSASGQGSSSKQPSSGEDEQEASGNERPKIVPAGDAFDGTGLVTDGSQAGADTVRRMPHHPSDTSSRQLTKEPQSRGKQTEAQFSEDEQSQSQSNLSPLPNIRQPVGGVNFQGLQPDLRAPQRVFGPPSQQARQPPPGSVQSPNGQFFGEPRPTALLQGQQNSRPQQPQLFPQPDGTFQRPGQSLNGAGQQRLDAPPQQQRSQFSFGRPIGQGPQGGGPQFLAQPPRVQSQQEQSLQGPPSIGGQPPSGPRSSEQQRTAGATNPQGGAPQQRISPSQGLQPPSPVGGPNQPPSALPPAQPRPPAGAPQQTSTAASQQPESSTLATDPQQTVSQSLPVQPRAENADGPLPPVTSTTNSPSTQSSSAPDERAPPGRISAPAQLPPGIHPPSPPRPPGATVISASDAKPKSGDNEANSEPASQ